VVQGNTITTISPTGQVLHKSTFHLDVASTPRALDLTYTEGPMKGATSLGIYELDGDPWKICSERFLLQPFNFLEALPLIRGDVPDDCFLYSPAQLGQPWFPPLIAEGVQNRS
jgi:hypothetical protein